MNAPVRILIVDDHREIREVIAQILSNEGFAVTVAADGAAMRRSLQDRKIDLVILDLMLPGEDGLSLCRELRTMMPTLPVIMVTAKGEEVDRVVGLEVGADDYVTKPFSSRELVARIKAVLRRARPPAAQPLEVRSYRFAGWRLNTLSRNLESPEGVVVPLSTSEFQLLLVFLTKPRTVLTRDQLLDMAKGREATPFDRSIDTHVSRLRRKLSDDARSPEIIKTVWGGGYIFTPEVIRE
jgi:two-component system, OmpR family, response regulator